MLYDIIAFAVSFFMVVIYYLCLMKRCRRAPDSNVHTLNAKIREQWVAMIMKGSNKDILAVQTLRNSVMAANFMASTAVLLIIGTLNISEKIGQWALNWYSYVLAHEASGQLWQIKLGLLLLDFSVAFYCFLMSIRLFNHVGYMINLSGDASAESGLVKQTCAYLNKAGSYYSFGTRSFFFSLPIILWFFGPYTLVLGTIALIAGLAMLDKVPN
jgi:uncharacterized membrane protein